MSVASPCISVCTIDEPTGFCRGCKRTVQEVGMWLYMNDAEKTKVLETLRHRQLSTET